MEGPVLDLDALAEQASPSSTLQSQFLGTNSPTDFETPQQKESKSSKKKRKVLESPLSPNGETGSVVVSRSELLSRIKHLEEENAKLKKELESISEFAKDSYGRAASTCSGLFRDVAKVKEEVNQNLKLKNEVASVTRRVDEMKAELQAVQDKFQKFSPLSSVSNIPIQEKTVKAIVRMVENDENSRRLRSVFLKGAPENCVIKDLIGKIAEKFASLNAQDIFSMRLKSRDIWLVFPQLETKLKFMREVRDKIKSLSRPIVGSDLAENEFTLTTPLRSKIF
eukprot:Pompholyxophrys_punicea_v1_NODE_440_length_1966_cov_23.319895.p1 type:complete len:281 gc:universal NODE_440_length_1966_cov_23.319895:737-1579(+)